MSSTTCYPSAGRPLRLVMVGNGLTDGVADALLELATAMGHWTSVQVDRVTTANFSLGDHMAAAKVDKSRYVPEGVNAVIVQEQSEAPGFFDWARREGGLKAWDTSLESVKYFAGLAKEANADIVLLENWAYQDGDIENAIYPTFDVMQNLLTKGSRELESASESAAQDGRLHVVPVGEVFRKVKSRAAGVNDDFQELFWMQQASGHRKVLSKNGQWLAAAVIIRSLTGSPPPLPVGSDALKARLAADIPTGPGPCDGNPQFGAEVNVTPQVPEVPKGGAQRLGAGAMALLGALMAVPALA